MNNFNKLYEELLEAMDRRQFLKFLSKGASVAGVAPGAVGKMAMNLATGSAPIDINKTIIDFLNLTYDGKTFIDLGPSKSLDLIRNSLSTLYSFIVKNKLPINDKFTVKEVKQALKELDPANIKKVMDEDNMTIDDFFQNFSEQGGDIDGFDGMLRVLFQHNLINKEAQKALEEYTGTHWYDYVDTPEAKKIRDEIEAGHRRNFHQYQQQHTAKDINYSRMDTAGGSEDVGYAQTFEKFFIENYADGKNPGRKGLAKRSGVNCKQSVSKLRKIAKNSSGERQRMAHWCANMKSGKKRKK